MLDVLNERDMPRAVAAHGALPTMIALKSDEEFALHVSAGFDGPPESRLTPDDIQEVIYQAASHCGVPAANHAMSVAAAILREKDLLPLKETP